MNDLEGKMKPNGMSYAGFLGADEKLEDVLAMDDKTVKELGLTHEKIAQMLEYLVRKELQMLSNVYEKGDLDEMSAVRRQGVEIDGKYIIRSKSYMGFQGCPWEGSCEYGSSDFTVTNKTTGEQISFPGLIIHLIKAHHFYEGKGTHYRLDPTDAVRVLEIKPDGDYSLEIIKENYWSGGSSTGDLGENFCGSKGIKDTAGQIMDIADGIKAYVSGKDLLITAERGLQLNDSLIIDDLKVPIYKNKIWKGQSLYHKNERERVIV